MMDIFFKNLVRNGNTVIFSYYAYRESTNDRFDLEETNINLKYIISTTESSHIKFEELINGTLYEINDVDQKLFLLKKCKINLLEILNNDDSKYDTIKDIDYHIIQSFNDYIQNYLPDSNEINTIRKIYI